jgi:hypothetical protein
MYGEACPSAPYGDGWEVYYTPAPSSPDYGCGVFATEQVLPPGAYTMYFQTIDFANYYTALVRVRAYDRRGAALSASVGAAQNIYGWQWENQEYSFNVEACSQVSVNFGIARSGDHIGGNAIRLSSLYRLPD